MNKIENIQQLRLERQRLYIKKELLEDEIRQGFTELRDSFKPSVLVKDLLGINSAAELNGHAASPLTKNIGSTLLDMLVTGVLFRKSSYLKKFLSTFVVYSAGPALIDRITPFVKKTFKDWLASFFENKEDPRYPQPTVTENY